MILVEWNWEIDAQRGHDDLDVLLEGNSGIDYERRHDGYRCTNSHLN